MKKLFLAACLAAGTLAVTSVAANDVNARFKAIAEMPAGIANPKTANGILQSFMVVGKAEVLKSLPKQKALLKADKDAARSARNATAQYFNTSVKWQETSTGEFVAKTIGKSENDNAGTSTTETQTTDVTSEQSSACSEAALAGLQIVWAGQDSNGMRVHIYGWKASAMKSLSKASKLMSKTAKDTVTGAKVVEGARQQDPNAAFQNAEEKSAAAQQQVQQVQQQVVSGQNQQPAFKSTAAPDAADFL